MKNLLIGLLSFLWLVSANVGASELAKSCAVCHGDAGVSDNTMWPNLAGQQQDYLIKEMRAFRDGTRTDPGMPMALLEGKTDEQLVELASYYSSMEQAAPAPVQEGRPGIHVRATCVACHGMDGITVTSMWPNLSAQKEGYLKKQLLDYKSGKRKHPIMDVITSELTAQQLADVAKYYSQH